MVGKRAINLLISISESSTLILVMYEFGSSLPAAGDKIKKKFGEKRRIKKKFNIGDKAYKPKGYKFPCTVVSVFKNLNGDTRIVGEMDNNGMLHIFNENQLEHVE